MPADNIDRTTEQLLELVFECDKQIYFGLHLNTNIHIAAVVLFASGHRTEYAQRTYAELLPKFGAVILQQGNIFILTFHGTLAIQILRKYNKNLFIFAVASLCDAVTVAEDGRSHDR